MQEPFGQEPLVRRAFRVRGHVQGVGFRWWAWRRARELGLRGFVRNLPDGSVEVEAMGPADAVERLRTLLAQGPPAARVEAVEELTPSDGILPPDFEIVA